MKLLPDLIPKDKLDQLVEFCKKNGKYVERIALRDELFQKNGDKWYGVYRMDTIRGPILYVESDPSEEPRRAIIDLEPGCLASAVYSWFDTVRVDESPGMWGGSEETLVGVNARSVIIGRGRESQLLSERLTVYLFNKDFKPVKRTSFWNRIFTDNPTKHKRGEYYKNTSRSWVRRELDKNRLLRDQVLYVARKD